MLIINIQHTTFSVLIASTSVSTSSAPNHIAVSASMFTSAIDGTPTCGLGVPDISLTP